MFNSILVPGNTLAKSPKTETGLSTWASALSQWKLFLSIHKRPKMNTADVTPQKFILDQPQGSDLRQLSR